MSAKLKINLQAYNGHRQMNGFWRISINLLVRQIRPEEALLRVPVPGPGYDGRKNLRPPGNNKIYLQILDGAMKWIVSTKQFLYEIAVVHFQMQ